MRKLLLPLALLTLALADKPQLKVSPNYAQPPATVTMLLLNIPASCHVACFVVDGPQSTGSCRELDGQRSWRMEYHNLPEGHYQASATLDGKIVGTAPLQVGSPEGDPDGI